VLHIILSLISTNIVKQFRLHFFNIKKLSNQNYWSSVCLSAVGKTYTMIGLDDSAEEIGVIPSAISWLYQLIEEQKQLTGARFSVRVSAVELTGRQETLRDLLSSADQQGLFMHYNEGST